MKAFRGWSVGRLVHLANFLELLELQAGETAFQQGDVADGLCILLSGQCKVCVDSGVVLFHMCQLMPEHPSRRPK